MNVRFKNTWAAIYIVYDCDLFGGTKFIDSDSTYFILLKKRSRYIDSSASQPGLNHQSGNIDLAGVPDVYTKT